LDSWLNLFTGKAMPAGRVCDWVVDTIRDAEMRLVSRRLRVVGYVRLQRLASTN